ncbi:MAG: hypothetical protein HY924_08970 [Elusimicrobia bacterium]|nr:hypothetical protein [Elusimicrobiota bacterium]
MNPLKNLMIAAAILACGAPTPAWAIACLNGQGPLQEGQGYCTGDEESTPPEGTVCTGTSCTLPQDYFTKKNDSSFETPCTVCGFLKADSGYGSLLGDDMGAATGIDGGVVGSCPMDSQVCGLKTPFDDDVAKAIEEDPELREIYEKARLENKDKMVAPVKPEYWGTWWAEQAVKDAMQKQVQDAIKDLAYARPGTTYSFDGKQITQCDGSGACAPVDRKELVKVAALEKQKKLDQEKAQKERDQQLAKANKNQWPSSGSDTPETRGEGGPSDDSRAPATGPDEGSEGAEESWNPGSVEGSGGDDITSLVENHADPTGQNNLYASNNAAGRKSGQGSSDLSIPDPTQTLARLTWESYSQPKDLGTLAGLARDARNNRMTNVENGAADIKGPDVWNRIAHLYRGFFDGSQETTVDVAPVSHCVAQDAACIEREKQHRNPAQ